MFGRGRGGGRGRRVWVLRGCDGMGDGSAWFDVTGVNQRVSN
jgi:hypothetical protein